VSTQAFVFPAPNAARSVQLAQNGKQLSCYSSKKIPRKMPGLKRKLLRKLKFAA